MPEPLLGAAAIERYLGEVADELTDRGPKQTVIVVGGALLAWHGLRDATATSTVPHVSTGSSPRLSPVSASATVWRRSG